MSALSYTRSDPGYEAARRATMWNALVPDRFPTRIVVARSEAEVVEAVRSAARDGLQVGVRSGGHSWAGNHVRDGVLLLDLSALDEVRVDKAAMRAVVGPGKGGSVLLHELVREGLFFPAGHCEGVKLGGYLLQGGFGWNGRALGMACQNVVAIDYVDADGVVRHASETENADVLWAARGAGPGFFGVVLRFHLRLHPCPGFFGAAAATYDATRLDEVFAWADAVGPEVPEEVELDLLVSRDTPRVKGVGVQVNALVFAKSWKDARRANHFLSSRPGGARLVLPTAPLPLGALYKGAMSHYPAGTRWCVDNMWTHRRWPELREGVQHLADTLPGSPSHLLWMNWYPPARPDMAFSCEDQTYLAVYAGWQDPSDDARNVAWATGVMAAMAPLASGVQLADENLGRRPARFVSEEALGRLDRLRAAHDPAGRFLSWMGRP